MVEVINSSDDLSDFADDVWDTVDSSGAPIKLHSIRFYTDYAGNMLNSEVLPWNYQIPIFRESHVAMAISNAVNRIFLKQYAFTGVTVGQPSSMDDAWRRFEITMRATATFCAEQKIPLLIVAISGNPAHKDIYTEPIRKFIVDELHLPYLGTDDLLPAANRLPNDAHLNVEGNRALAHALESFVAPYLPRRASTEVADSF